MNLDAKKKQFRYLNAQKELDAHLFTIDSPDEYYNWAEYERLTPTHVWVVWNWIFLGILHFTKESIVYWYHCPNTVFSPTVHLKNTQRFSVKKKFHQKIFYFWNAKMTKYVHINFYRNRTTLAYLKNTKPATRKRPVFRTFPKDTGPTPTDSIIWDVIAMLQIH